MGCMCAMYVLGYIQLHHPMSSQRFCAFWSLLHLPCHGMKVITYHAALQRTGDECCMLAALQCTGIQCCVHLLCACVRRGHQTEH